MAKAYLQFGDGAGPFQTVAAEVRDAPAYGGGWYGTRFELNYEGRWRRIFSNGRETWCAVAGRHVRVTLDSADA